MKKFILIVLAAILFLTPFVVWGHSYIKTIEFDVNCGDYLKLAADANSIDVAEKHLAKAVTYLETHNLTSGYTKVFYYKPTNDIGMWYENLKTAHTQLQEMQATEYTELDQSNMLMKLRETILNDNGTLTHPQGISMVPYFTLLFWLNVILWLPCWGFGIVIVYAADGNC